MNCPLLCIAFLENKRSDPRRWKKWEEQGMVQMDTEGKSVDEIQSLILTVTRSTAS